MSHDRPPRSVFDYAMVATMRRAERDGKERQPHHPVARCRRRRRRRDARGLPGRAEPAVRHGAGRRHLLRRQHRRRGRLPVHGGRDRITGAGQAARRPSSRPATGRAACCRAPTKKLYAGVGSLTNIAEQGMEVEEGRAAVYELDLASRHAAASSPRACATPVGLAWEPDDGRAVDRGQRARRAGRRDAARLSDLGARGRLLRLALLLLGPDGRRSRAAGRGDGRQGASQPDYALGGHTASLGLCWVPAGTLPGFPDGMAIGQHGSWNRSTLSGYKLVFIPFENGSRRARRATSCRASSRRTRRSRTAARSA